MFMYLLQAHIRYVCLPINLSYLMILSTIWNFFGVYWMFGILTGFPSLWSVKKFFNLADLLFSYFIILKQSEKFKLIRLFCRPYLKYGLWLEIAKCHQVWKRIVDNLKSKTSKSEHVISAVFAMNNLFQCSSLACNICIAAHFVGALNVR